jgi:serine/threonine protein phosphatase PrpC
MWLRVPIDNASAELLGQSPSDQPYQPFRVEAMPIHTVEASMDGDGNESMACRFIMDVRENGLGYQEDSCAVFYWKQQFQGTAEEKTPIILFTIADAHAAKQNERGDTAALGPIVAKRMRDGFEKVLEGFPSDCFDNDNSVRKDVEKQLADQGLAVDESLLKDGLGQDCGTTFSFALVTPSHVVLGNVGDSSVFYGKSLGSDKNLADCSGAPTFGVEQLHRMKKEYEMVLEIWCSTPTHTSRDDIIKELRKRYSSFACTLDELDRLASAGMEMGERYVGRHPLNRSPCLGFTRSFGDFDLKRSDVGGLELQGIIARPSIKIYERVLDRKETIGLFTDGVVFEFRETPPVSSRDIPVTYNRCYKTGYKIAAEHIMENWSEPSLLKAANRMHDHASRHRRGTDNAGMILVQLKPSEQKMALSSEAPAMTSQGTETGAANKKAKPLAIDH